MMILIVYLIIGILFSIGFVIEYYKNDGSPLVVKIIVVLLIATFYPCNYWWFSWK